MCTWRPEEKDAAAPVQVHTSQLRCNPIIHLLGPHFPRCYIDSLGLYALLLTTCTLLFSQIQVFGTDSGTVAKLSHSLGTVPRYRPPRFDAGNFTLASLSEPKTSPGINFGNKKKPKILNRYQSIPNLANNSVLHALHCGAHR